MAMYSRVSYWNHRYLVNAENAPYEWYMGYSSLRHLVNPIHFSAQNSGFSKSGGGTLLTTPSVTSFPSNNANFPPRDKCRVLILGCGNSTFGEQMQRDGWAGPIVNVDFSNVVIDLMKAKYNQTYYEKYDSKQRSPPQPMEFLCADVTERLPFEDHSFDLIISKGSFDALLCGAGFKTKAMRLVKEVVRLLVPGSGVFFLVTNGSPDNRVEFLERDNQLDGYWESVFVHGVPNNRGMGKTDYVYICRRRADDEHMVCDKIVSQLAVTPVHTPLSTTGHTKSQGDDLENRY